MLVGNAQNLMLSVKETVRAAEAASIKIRTGKRRLHVFVSCFWCDHNVHATDSFCYARGVLLPKTSSTCIIFFRSTIQNCNAHALSALNFLFVTSKLITPTFFCIISVKNFQGLLCKTPTLRSLFLYIVL